MLYELASSLAVSGLFFIVPLPSADPYPTTIAIGPDMDIRLELQTSPGKKFGVQIVNDDGIVSAHHWSKRVRNCEH